MRGTHKVFISAAILAGCAHRPVVAGPTPTAGSESDPQLQTIMLSMLETITKLQPMMVSERAFESSANRVAVAKGLGELASLSAEAARAPALQTPAYRGPGRALQAHAAETERAFRRGQHRYARLLLQATPSACIDCHTQGGVSGAKALWVLTAADLGGTAFERAEFLFATRNYEAALGLYDEAIAKFPREGAEFTTTELEAAVKRKLTYYVRVQDNRQGAYESLRRDLRNRRLPRSLRRSLQAWATQLQGNLRAGAREATTIEATLARARRSIGGTRASDDATLIERLSIAGRLSDALRREPNGPQAAEELYWLGLAELGLQRHFFFSSGSLYLKECVREHASTQIAKRCYSALEADAVSLYSGSRGVELPNDVADELESLKALVDGPKGADESAN